ncbi:MAG: FAD-dependent oxidoreductase [Chloroflexi bacterium]|nr:FAD-dependent oxidoreductase [Chloroflexota bacterium]
MQPRFPYLLSPIRIGNAVVRNRLVSSAHGTNFGSDHHPTQRHVAYHAARARGGIGLIIMENTRVHPTSRGVPASLEAWDEATIPSFRAVADAVHEHGARVLVQLHHAGRNANSMDTLLPVWAPSAITIPWANPSGSNEVSHEMTREDIQDLLRWWARCAVHMKRAGTDGVEIHGAHGFLVGQFLSPLTNHRTDEYGGSIRNRTRFPLELAHAIRQAVGRDFIVGIRLSADELVPGGITVEQAAVFSRLLEAGGDLDFLNISHSVEYAPYSLAQQIPDMSWPQGAYVHLAEAIKKATRGIPVFAIGRIADPMLAEEILASGKADMVCMTRAHLADPEIGRKLVEGRPEDIRPCIGCNQGCCGRALVVGKPIGCLVNPEAGREYELGPVTQASHRKEIAVVGGGPAGLEAARIAALRGHRVTLYEKSDRLGGQVNTLTKAPYRQEFGKATAWLEQQVKKLGVTVKLSTEATPSTLRGGADAVVVATGSVPQVPEIRGAGGPSSPRVVSVYDVLEGRVPLGREQRVVLMEEDGTYKSGGTAEFMAERGAEVHWVTGASVIGRDLHLVSQVPLVRRLRQKKVTFHLERLLKAVEGKTVVLSEVYDGDGEAIEGVDLIVTSVQNVPVTGLYETLRAEGRIPEVVAVGDCVAPRKAMEAIREGHMAGRIL